MIKDKIAVVILACKDFESLEVSLCNYLEHTPDENVHFFVLQNGFGSYDKNRTLAVARKYHDLYPERITVVDWLKENKPYRTIKNLLHDKVLSSYKYVCKVDDDTFPVTDDWVEKLYKSYLENKKKYGKDLAFTFPLVNNNPYGFKKTIEIMGLEKEYKTTIGRKHYAGSDWDHPMVQKYYPLRIFEKDEIFPSGFGTVWRYPYMARWIHNKTTLDVDNWIKALENAPDELFDNNIRYSINCMFFEKEYWDLLDNGTDDDEGTVHEVSLKLNQKLIAVCSVPFVHLFFFSQREENKDMLTQIVQYYTKRLGINYPMTLYSNKETEIENRLRYIEECLNTIQIISSEAYLTNFLRIQKIKAFLTFGKCHKKYEKRIKYITDKLSEIRKYQKLGF